VRQLLPRLYILKADFLILDEVSRSIELDLTAADISNKIDGLVKEIININNNAHAMSLVPNFPDNITSVEDMNLSTGAKQELDDALQKLVKKVSGKWAELITPSP